MDIKILKPFRYGGRIFEKGEVGTVVPIETVEHPLEWKGTLIYDYYVKFADHLPVGVFKEEVEAESVELTKE